jgi:hypothetical protein
VFSENKPYVEEAMAKNKETLDPIPESFAFIEEAAEFWDTHDLADYWDFTEEVEFEVDIQHRRHLVALDPELAKKLTEEARQRGLSVETLINLWLNERLQQAKA